MMLKSCIDLRCDYLKMDRVPGRGYPRNIWSCPVRTIQVGYTVELMPQKNCPRLKEIAESEGRMCELTQNELAIERGHLHHEVEYLQKLVADIRAAKEQVEKERDGLTGLLSIYSQDVDRFQNQVRELETKIEKIEAEHGQKLRGMRSFSMNLEARLEEAEREARQETNRANNAALRAERNALRLKRLESIIPNPAVLRSMADEIACTHDYVADKLQQYALHIEEAQN